MTKRVLKVGLDFDGVVAYNPFRVIRPFAAYFKRNILGVRKLQFWYPKKKWQQFFWIVLHESSIFPSKGVELLGRLVKENVIEVHLITARYSFLDDHLNNWLKKYKLYSLFKTININRLNEQPHIFKEKMIKKYGLDYFVEDNLDIVRYLNQKPSTKIYWIYNILDHFVEYPHKFPYLGKALINIIKNDLKTPE